MATAKVLKTSSEVHAAIRQLLGTPSPSDRRVVVVAYLGAGAEAYLPHPEGLHIICNPQAGATDPVVVRRLLVRKARVQFSDQLHMKVYWSRSRGCVITSANASTNALGASGLKEAGVLLPRGHVDIDHLIAYAKPDDVTARTLRTLDRETRTHDQQFASQPNRQRANKQTTSYTNFLEWYRLARDDRWKLGWSNDSSKRPAREATELVRVEYGKGQPFCWIDVAPRTVKIGDWLLSFTVDGDRVHSIGWFYTRFVVPYAKSESHNPSYSLQAIQVHPLRQCPVRLFPISPEFRQAFVRASKAFGIDRIMDIRTLLPPKQLLDMIVDAWPK